MKELIPIHRIKKINLLLLALAHPAKRKIIQLLDEKQVLMVSDFTQILKLSQPIISQHLATLRKYKIVYTQRKGKHILYYLHKTKLQQIEMSIENFD